MNRNISYLGRVAVCISFGMIVILLGLGLKATSIASAGALPTEIPTKIGSEEILYTQEGEGDNDDTPEEDPSEGWNPGSEFDETIPVDGDIDPVDGFLPGYESFGPGDPDICLTDGCDDGGEKIDPLGSPSPDEVDICALGQCDTDPMNPEEDSGEEAEGGKLDYCQAGETCEEGEREEQESTETDKDDDCDESDSSKHCSQDSDSGSDSGDTDDGTQEVSYPDDEWYSENCSGCAQNGDEDGDGLINDDERRAGTNPHNSDTDSDGLLDGEEWGGAPNVKGYTDPLNPDTDGDGIPDGAEVGSYWSDPTNPDSILTDIDGDGIVNEFDDSDGDGFTDAEEITPRDLNGDGKIDGYWETHGSNPYMRECIPGDSDCDGWGDSNEKVKGTDPHDASSHP